MASAVVTAAVDTATSAIADIKLAAGAQSALPKPLQLSGALADQKQFDVTTVIGREFPETQVKDLIDSPNADALLRDLAITVSQRGVVFFRNQNLEAKDLKFLVQRLGELTGKPADSGLVSPFACCCMSRRI